MAIVIIAAEFGRPEEEGDPYQQQLLGDNVPSQAVGDDVPPQVVVDGDDWMEQPDIARENVYGDPEAPLEYESEDVPPPPQERAKSDIDQFVRSLQERSGGDRGVLMDMAEELETLIMMPSSTGEPLYERAGELGMGTAWESLPSMVSLWRGDSPFENYFRSFVTKQQKKEELKEKRQETGITQAVEEMYPLDPYINAVRWGKEGDQLIPSYVEEAKEEWDKFGTLEAIRESYIANEHEFGRSKGLPLGARYREKDGEEVKNTPNYFRQIPDMNEYLKRESPSRVERAIAHWNEVSDRLSMLLSEKPEVASMFPAEHKTFMQLNPEMRYIYPRDRDSRTFLKNREINKYILDKAREEQESGMSGPYTQLANDIGLNSRDMFVMPTMAEPGKEDEYPTGGEYFLTPQMVAPKDRNVGNKDIARRSDYIARGRKISISPKEEGESQIQISEPGASAPPVGIQEEDKTEKSSEEEPRTRSQDKKIPPRPKFNKFVENIPQTVQRKLSELGIDLASAFDRIKKHSDGIDVLAWLAENKLWQNPTPENELKKEIAESFAKSPAPLSRGNIGRWEEKFSEVLEPTDEEKENLAVPTPEDEVKERKKKMGPNARYYIKPSYKRQKLNLLAQDAVDDLYAALQAFPEEFAAELQRRRQRPEPAQASRLRKFKQANIALAKSLLRMDDDISDMFGTGVKGFVARLIAKGTPKEKIEEAVRRKFPREIPSSRKESFETMLFDVDSKMNSYMER